MIRRSVLAAALALVPAAAWAEPPDIDHYKGADAGRIVFSGTTTLQLQLALQFRRLDPPGVGAVVADPWNLPMGAGGLVGMMIKQADIPAARIPPPEGMPADLRDRGYEFTKQLQYRGQWASATLPPGRYEITRLVLTTGTLREDLDGLAIPFEVRQGRTTYLGDFRAVGVKAKARIGLNLLQGWYVEVSDQSARDLAAIRSKHPEYGEIEVSVPVTPPVIHPAMLQ